RLCPDRQALVGEREAAAGQPGQAGAGKHETDLPVLRYVRLSVHPDQVVLARLATLRRVHDRPGFLHLAVRPERPTAPGSLSRARADQAARVRAGAVPGRVEAEEFLPECDQPRPPDAAQRADAPGGPRGDDRLLG